MQVQRNLKELQIEYNLNPFATECTPSFIIKVERLFLNCRMIDELKANMGSSKDVESPKESVTKISKNHF